MVAKVETGLVPIELPESTAVGFIDVDTTRGAYLAFPMGRSRRWDLMRAEIPNLQEYEPILTIQSTLGERYIRVSQNGMDFRCFWVGGLHCYANLNIETGAVLAARPDRTADRAYVELVEGVIIVITPEVLYPARVSFRNALASVGVALEQQREKVGMPAWAKEFPESMTAPPQFRYTARVSLSVNPSRRNPGFTYPVGRVKISGSTKADQAAFLDAAKCEDFRETMQAVLAQFGERAKEIRAHLKSA